MNKQLTDAVVAAALKSVADIPAGNRIMTCAAEATGCRRSFDVNVYKSGKKVRFIGDELGKIALFFHVSPPMLDTFLAESGDATLGHLSGGLDARNDPFFTMYFDDFTAFIKNRKT